MGSYSEPLADEDQMRIPFMSVRLTMYTIVLILSLGSFLGIAFQVELNLLFVASWGVLFVLNKKTVTQGQLIFLFALIFQVLVMTLANNGTESPSIFYLLLKVVLIVYSFNFYDRQIDTFLTYVTYTILGLSVLSNLIYVLVIIGIPFPLILVANTNTYFMLNAGYGIDFASVFGLIRNTGVFYEPGLYQFILSLGCIWSIENKRKWLFFYFLITLVSTFSIVGFANAAIALLLYTSRLTFTRKAFVVFFGLAGVAFLVDGVLAFLALKFGTLSFLLRAEDLKTGWNLFLENPIWGYGPSFSAESAFEGGTRNNSNGVWGVLHQFGIFGALMFFALVISALLKKRIMILLVTMTTLTTQNIFQTDFLLTLLTFVFLGRYNSITIKVARAKTDVTTA